MFTRVVLSVAESLLSLPFCLCVASVNKSSLMNPFHFLLSASLSFLLSLFPSLSNFLLSLFAPIPLMFLQNIYLSSFSIMHFKTL